MLEPIHCRDPSVKFRQCEMKIKIKLIFFFEKPNLSIIPRFHAIWLEETSEEFFELLIKQVGFAPLPMTKNFLKTDFEKDLSKKRLCYCFW